LCLDYGWPAAHSPSEVLLPGIIVLALLVLSIWTLAKRPAWGFLGAWFFVILAPTSSFVPISDAAFEHRMYLPLAAITSGTVLAGYLASQRLVQNKILSVSMSRNINLFVATAIVLVLGILTYQRNAVYASELSVWRDTAAKRPNNSRALNNYGFALARLGQVDSAIELFQKSLEIDPNYAEAHHNLGVALAGCGQIDEAMEHYRKAVQIAPNFAEAHKDLANALARSGRLPEAIAHYRQALECRPDYADAHNNLGVVLAGSGQLDEAIAHYRKALECRPDFADAHNNLGAALIDLGQYDEAIVHCLAALEINPDYAAANKNLLRA
jgi:protein O-mannosyl-transferase